VNENLNAIEKKLFAAIIVSVIAFGLIGLVRAVLITHSTGFEDGSIPTEWIRTGNWTVVSSPVYNGSYAAKVTSPSGSIANSSLVYDMAGYVNATLSFWVNFQHLPEVVSNDFKLMIGGFEISNGVNQYYIAFGLNPWTFYGIPCGYIVYDKGNGGAYPSFVPNADHWYNITIACQVGNYTYFDEWTRTFDYNNYQIYLDGDLFDSFSPYWEISGFGGVIPQGYESNYIKSAWVGARYYYGADIPVNCTAIFDDIVLDAALSPIVQPTPTPPPPPNVPTTYIVTIQVKNGTQLVQNALVSFDAGLKLTDSMGTVVFTGVWAGTYPITVTLNNEVKYTETHQISQDTTIIIDLATQTSTTPAAGDWLRERLQENWLIIAIVIGIAVISATALIERKRKHK
jgi:hypothetical protein